MARRNGLDTRAPWPPADEEEDQVALLELFSRIRPRPEIGVGGKNGSGNGDGDMLEP